MKRLLILLPERDFDPTESAVPWKYVQAAGYEVLFATPNGKPAQADLIMLTGETLGPLKWTLRADANGRRAYDEMSRSVAFQNPICYDELDAAKCDAILLPGGHAKGMRPYLESDKLQRFVRDFAATNKPTAAACHGVVLAARSGVLKGHKVTALPEWMEMKAWKVTRLWKGDYYRTYLDRTVESEVRAALTDPQTDFDPGPRNTHRDTPAMPETGFIVRDGNLLTARWPGDAHSLGSELRAILDQR